MSIDTLQSSPPSQNRVAIYMPTLVGGGAERVMLNLAVGFVKRGVPVDFVLAQREGAFVSEFPPEVNLIELNHLRIRFLRSIRSIPALVRYLRSVRPAALLTGLHANIISVWARQLAGVPLRLVISEHNTLSVHRQTEPFWMRAITSRLIRQTYPKADVIVAVSKGVAVDLAAAANLPLERITVVPNPIITPEMAQKAAEGLEHPWFQPGQPPVVLSVGRLTAQKDFPLLIRAFAEVRRAIPARLLILGDGPDRAELMALVEQLGLQEDVSLPGFIHNPYPYMARAAVFALSSAWEGLPTVLVEALYCGAPVVSTDCPSGPQEILEGGKYGRLVPVGDPLALAESILAAIRSGRALVPPEAWHAYETDTVVDRYLSLFFKDS